ncbi:MAG: hypothetical protein R3C41_11600 [Calditrichia bacterium]
MPASGLALAIARRLPSATQGRCMKIAGNTNGRYENVPAFAIPDNPNRLHAITSSSSVIRPQIPVQAFLGVFLNIPFRFA